MTDQERIKLCEATMKVHNMLNIFNSCERAARKAKQEYEKAQADQWMIINRILEAKP
jgi:hypothetical protein